VSGAAGAATPEGTAFLDPGAVAALLDAAGVPRLAERVVATAAEAVAAAAEIGFPVVLKLVAPALVHKSDIGGVLLGLGSAEAVEEGHRRLAAVADRAGIAAWQVLVQEQAPPAEAELLVGITRDPAFGPMLAVGSGGRLVELLDDVALHTCPVTPEQARALLATTLAGRLVEGYRGAPLDPEGAAAAIAAVSRIPLERPDVVELDVNPLAPGRDGCWRALDARVLVCTGDPAARAGAVLEPTAARPSLSGDEAATRVAALLDARSVAVVGASAADPAKPGSKILGFLRRHGYAGAVHVVHPSASEIQGYPCVAAIEELPHGAVDVACLAIPASACADAIDRLGRRGVRGVVVLSSGFAEAGDPAAERALAAAADAHGMGLCGPNTIGAATPGTALYATFTGAVQADRPVTGGIALVTQSGALGGSLLSQAWERGAGVSRFVSVGNQAQLAIADYLQFLARDEQTRVACVVVESVPDGPAFVAALAAMRAAGKPVVALKTGRSAVGGAAVRSHTGALAGDARVVDAVLAEGGAVRVGTLTELMDAAVALDRQPRPAGGRVGIVSTSGGGCAVAADLCAALGLSVPALAPATRATLDALLPAFAATQNPVDVTAQILVDPSLLERTLDALLADPGIDTVAVILTTVPDPQARILADGIVARTRAASKPVVVAWTIARSQAEDGISTLEREGVPVLPSIERALGALAALARAGTGGAAS
jgi:acyl-CoA synthetase (NDP forming)